MDDDTKMLTRIVAAFRLLAELPYSGVHVTAQKIIDDKATVARLLATEKENYCAANARISEVRRVQRENDALRRQLDRVSDELAGAKKKLKATVPFMTNVSYPPRAPQEMKPPTEKPPAPAKAPKKRGRPRNVRRGCFGGNLEKADTICELCADINECRAKQRKNIEKKKREKAR